MLADPAVLALSIDVYDTLLLRTTRPELLRFGDIAAAQHRALGAAGMQSPGAAALWKARLVVHKRIYDEARQNGTQARLTDILSALAEHAHLEDGALHHLAAAEIAYETMAVRPDRMLADLILTSDKRIILTSDMYLSAVDLARILAHHLPDLSGVPLIVSSDAQASKRQGDLFAHLPPLLGVPCERVLHVGDDIFADVEQARRAGLRAMHWPRNTVWRVVHWTKKRLAVGSLIRRGWIAKT